MRLRELRRERGLTLEEVGEAIDYNLTNLSRVERGRQTLSVPVARRLADYYGVTLNELISGEELPTTE